MILDGKALSKEIKENLKQQVKEINAKIKLVVILVGDNQSSQIYVASKEKACKLVGIESETILIDKNAPQKTVIDAIEKANLDDSVHGILVQLPLPKHMDEKTIINMIDPRKDVDGLTFINQGKLFNNVSGIVPATPLGIMHLIDSHKLDLSGKNAVVIGRSALVGKPIAQMLLARNATVTTAHSKTVDLVSLTRSADILVVAIGKPHFITSDMVKEGAIVIDVGINRVYGRIDGDVDFENVSQVASYITPVPGGVGPMTIACLLENVINCYKLQLQEEKE